MARESWDVVVVGAGPAGSTAAALLADRGHRVLLVDRARFPRSKPCGESLNPGAVRELGRLGLLLRVLRLPHVRIEGWRIQGGEGAGFVGKFPGGAEGLAVDRALLDASLLEHAREVGVEVRCGVKVVDLLCVGDVVTGVRTDEGLALAARLIIGADGLRSTVVRKLGLIRRRPRLRKLALTAHLRNVRLPGGFGQLHLRPWGCIGLVQIGPDLANAVIVLNGPAGLGVHGDREGAFDRAIATVQSMRAGARDGEVRATGPFDWPTKRVTADGALLVGDAAGYFDPFTGQGIFRALKAARLAAAAADDALRCGPCSSRALEPYELAYRKAFGAGERLQRAIEVAVSRPRLMRAASATFRTFPSLADRLVALTGDVRPSPMPDRARRT